MRRVFIELMMEEALRFEELLRGDQRLAKKKICAELPVECWELILNRLALCHYEDLQAPSLVCKQFLSITNRLRKKLEINSKLFFNDGCEPFRNALRRFRDLREIVLCNHDYIDFNYLVGEISSSGLDIHALVFRDIKKPLAVKSFRKIASAMKNLKVLSFFGCRSFGKRQLVAIADAFPGLEELCLSRSNPVKYESNVTDDQVEVMSSKLGRLLKIDVSGQFRCSDRSLVALSSNCKLLREIRISGCNVTEHGICLLLRHCQFLTSLELGRFIGSADASSSFTVENSIVYARSLRSLHLNSDEYGDRLITSVSNAGIQLEKIVVLKKYSSPSPLGGVSTFLRACPSLKQVQLFRIDFVTEYDVRDFCRRLPNLVSIKINKCPNITTGAFFILAKECPALSEIELTNLSGNDEGTFDVDFKTNYEIRTLDLSSNSHLTNEMLKKMGVVCPNLEALDVKRSPKLTKEGICQFLKCCSLIKHLTIDEKIGRFPEQFKTRHMKIKQYWE